MTVAAFQCGHHTGKHLLIGLPNLPVFTYTSWSVALHVERLLQRKKQREAAAFDDFVR